jgi:hypothetical protein
LTIQLKVLCIVLALAFIFYIFQSVVHKKINEKQSLLWFLCGLISLLLAIFPEILITTSAGLGIIYKPTLLFLLSIMFSMAVLFLHTIQITKLTEQNRKLAQQVGLLTHAMEKEDRKKQNWTERDEAL